MRIVSVLFSLFFSFQCFSQKPEKDLQVKFQVYIDGDWPITYPSILHVKENTTIYQIKPFLKENWDGGKVKSNVPYNAAPQKMIPDDYLKINHTGKELLEFRNLPTVSALVTDIYPELKWVVGNESKKIAGYNCIKATTSYRGRKWNAWFAPDIAVPFGPWKLHGLPGIILEAYDDTEMFIMRAAVVEHVKSDLFDQDFKKLRNTYNKQAITYRQFLADRDEAFDNIAKEMNKDGANMKVKEVPRNGIELKYEWEE